MPLVGLMLEGSFSRRCSSIHETPLQRRLWPEWTNCLPSHAEARRRGIGLAGRHALRQERARRLLEDIRSKIEAALSVALPSSALSKACQYTLTLWRKLTRFLEYPELELSNNLAENSMRPVALGRKNWIHIGSPQAGPKVAAILSVVESSRRLRLPVRDYLATVLPGFADLPIQRLPDLTPAAWVAQHS